MHRRPSEAEKESFIRKHGRQPSRAEEIDIIRSLHVTNFEQIERESYQVYKAKQAGIRRGLIEEARRKHRKKIIYLPTDHEVEHEKRMCNDMLDIITKSLTYYGKDKTISLSTSGYSEMDLIQIRRHYSLYHYDDEGLHNPHHCEVLVDPDQKRDPSIQQLIANAEQKTEAEILPVFNAEELKFGSDNNLKIYRLIGNGRTIEGVLETCAEGDIPTRKISPRDILCMLSPEACEILSTEGGLRVEEQKQGELKEEVTNPTTVPTSNIIHKTFEMNLKIFKIIAGKAHRKLKAMMRNHKVGFFVPKSVGESVFVDIMGEESHVMQAYARLQEMYDEYIKPVVKAAFRFVSETIRATISVSKETSSNIMTTSRISELKSKGISISLRTKGDEKEINIKGPKEKLNDAKAKVIKEVKAFEKIKVNHHITIPKSPGRTSRARKLASNNVSVTKKGIEIVGQSESEVQKRVKSILDNTVTESYMIPNSMIGKVVGYAHANIRTIAQRCKVHLEAPKVRNDRESPIKITGSKQNISRAKDAIALLIALTRAKTHRLHVQGKTRTADKSSKKCQNLSLINHRTYKPTSIVVTQPASGFEDLGCPSKGKNKRNASPILALKWVPKPE